jgi:hypothetical protein
LTEYLLDDSHDCENDHTHNTCAACGKCDSCADKLAENQFELYEIQLLISASLKKNAELSATDFAHDLLSKFQGIVNKRDPNPLESMAIMPAPHFILMYLVENVKGKASCNDPSSGKSVPVLTAWREFLINLALDFDDAQIEKHTLEQITSATDIDSLSDEDLTILVLGVNKEKDVSRESLFINFSAYCPEGVYLTAESYRQWHQEKTKVKIQD